MRLVLIVEDKLEEQAKAKRAVVETGFKPVVAPTLSDSERFLNKLSGSIVGIVTDIHFPKGKGFSHENPNGLSVMKKAIERGLPVSVCTDVDHHFSDYLEDALKIYSQVAGYDIPATLDRKNWQQAVSDLRRLIN